MLFSQPPYVPFKLIRPGLIPSGLTRFGSAQFSLRPFSRAPMLVPMLSLFGSL